MLKRRRDLLRAPSRRGRTRSAVVQIQRRQARQFAAFAGLTAAKFSVSTPRLECVKTGHTLLRRALYARHDNVVYRRLFFTRLQANPQSPKVDHRRHDAQTRTGSHLPGCSSPANPLNCAVHRYLRRPYPTNADARIARAPGRDARRLVVAAAAVTRCVGGGIGAARLCYRQ